MKIIELSKNGWRYKGLYTTTVDDADYDWLNQYNWQVNINEHGDPYAVMVYNRKMIKMHRFILGATDSNIQVDHKDRNSLNNQRGNLRLATQMQQSYNRGKQKQSSSPYKGVQLSKERKDRKTTNISTEYYISWRVRIRVNGKRLDLGSYKTAEEGAKVYDEAAKKYFGEFAVLNFPKL